MGHGDVFSHLIFSCQNLINRGDWLWSPANIKGANKEAKIWVGRSTTLHNLLFCAHTLSMNYVNNTFLLVSSSVRSKQLLCFVQGQAQRTEQKHTTKNFVEFHNHSLLLTKSCLKARQLFPNIERKFPTIAAIAEDFVGRTDDVSIIQEHI